MLLTAGKQWTVNVLESPEVVNGEATVFVKVSNLTEAEEEVPVEESRGRKRSRSHDDKERKYDDGERKSSRGRKERRRREDRRSGTERRSTREHTVNARQLDEATVPYDSCKGTASESVPGEVTGEVSPTMIWTQRDGCW